MTRSRPETGPAPPEGLPPGAISPALLSWYADQARDLPWRRTGDPYAIWVSEVMLQQTRVETVLPYYARFLETFPDLPALAAAGEDEVLARWSGLGYYSRARRLHAGAAYVRERHGGRFPETYPEALAVPGVGPYTAAAILSIAYGAAHAVVDGNVARVLARLLRLDPPWDRRTSYLQARADEILDPERAGDHNQAMMELGATVCLPRNPRCPECPIEESCRARADGVEDRYPAPRPKRPVREIEQTLFLLEDPAGAVLLERGAWPILPHLWLPPIVETASPDERPGDAWRRWRESDRVGACDLEAVGSFRHAITHRRILFRVIRGRAPSLPSGPDLRPVGPHEWDEVAHSAIARKARHLRGRAQLALEIPAPEGPGGSARGSGSRPGRNEPAPGRTRSGRATRRRTRR